MKVAVISDIHGNAEALENVIKDIRMNNIDSVIVLGDVIIKGSEPMRCYELLKQLEPIAWIKGNTDDWLNEIDDNFVPKNDMEMRIYKQFCFAQDILSDEAIEFIKKLPETHLLTIKDRSILCAHGSDRSYSDPIGIMTSREEIEGMIGRMNYDVLLCGHTHSPYVVSANGKLIMNVGSVGSSCDDEMATYGLIEISDDNYQYSIRKVKINA